MMEDLAAPTGSTTPLRVTRHEQVEQVKETINGVPATPFTTDIHQTVEETRTVTERMIETTHVHGGVTRESIPVSENSEAEKKINTVTTVAGTTHVERESAPEVWKSATSTRPGQSVLTESGSVYRESTNVSNAGGSYLRESNMSISQPQYTQSQSQYIISQPQYTSSIGQTTVHQSQSSVAREGSVVRESEWINTGEVRREQLPDRVIGTNHLGFQKGQETVIGTSQRIDSSQKIISERIVEHEVVVPKRIIREDLVEKVIVVPEKIRHEEIVEEVQHVREKIIEIAVPVIQERIVEVPEIEYIEKIVEVPEIVIQERIVEVNKVEIKERIVEVPTIIEHERIIEVPEIEYREVPVERIVEVPEIHEQIVIKEIPVPQYVDKPVPEYVDVEQLTQVNRVIPIPVEAITTCTFRLPRLRPRYSAVEVPLIIPRFVEVPVAADSIDAQTAMHIESMSAQLTAMVSRSQVSGQEIGLCEIENLAKDIRGHKFDERIVKSDAAERVRENWMAGRIHVERESMQFTTEVTKAVI